MTTPGVGIKIIRVSSLTHAEVRRLLLANDPWLTLGYTNADADAIADASDSQTVFIARKGAETVGFVLAQAGILFGEYLKILVVDAQAQGQRVGSALMDALETKVFAERPNIYLCVSDFNTGAQEFYRRRGYCVVGELTELLVAGRHEIFMRKTVGNWRDFKQVTKS